MIALTSAEQALFNTLLEVREANKLNTVMRVAGGWVRDKVGYTATPPWTSTLPTPFPYL
jgi:hypothetical protein